MRAEDYPDRPRGQFHRQVNVLDVNSLRNLRFRAVVVLGLVERSFPPPPRQDALLLDGERARLRAEPRLRHPPRAQGRTRNRSVRARRPRRRRAPAAQLRAQHDGRLAGEAALLLLPRRGRRAHRARRPRRGCRRARRPLFTRVPGSRFAAPEGERERALDLAEYDRTLLLDEPALGAAIVAELRPQLTRARTAYDSRWRTAS